MQVRPDQSLSVRPTLRILIFFNDCYLTFNKNSQSFILDKVFKNGPSEICGRQTNFIWSILEYFVPYIRNSNSNIIIPNNKCVTNLYRSEAKSKNSVIITFTYTSLKNYESYSRVPNNHIIIIVQGICARLLKKKEKSVVFSLTYKY